jgi:hypothetical protein
LMARKKCIHRRGHVSPVLGEHNRPLALKTRGWL